MKTLEECRKELDEIDNKIIELFEQRMSVIKDVALYKKENNLPVLDKEREALMFEKNLKKFNNAELQNYYKIVLQGYLDASKQYQNDILKR